MTDNRYSKYPTELWDGFDVLCKTTGSEIQFIKDMLKFFKKRVEIEETYVKSLQKLAKKDQYSTSSFATLNRAFESSLRGVEAEAAIHNRVSIGVTQKVCDALVGLIKDMEAERKQLSNDGTKLNDEKTKLEDSLKKVKSEYDKSCKEAEIATLTFNQATSEGAAKAKDLQKLEKEKDKKKKSSQEAEEVYKKKVVEVNTFLEKYFEEKMPKILSDFEHMDMVRNHMLKNNMKKYLQVLSDVPPLLSRNVDSLTATVESVHTEHDLNEFVSKSKTGKEIPDAYEFEAYQEGNQQPKKLKGKAFKKASIPSVSPASPTPQRSSINLSRTAIFGIPLKDVLGKQKEKYPDAEVPVLLVNLVDAIFKLDGVHTEGIFRVPAPAPEVQAFKDRINSGAYDSISTCSEVHTPCALMKLWLREIPEPLISTDLYETCIQTPEQAFEVLSKIPPENQKVITFVIQFLKELAKPEVVAFTKMTADNLGMVFAPSFLRCPYQDYNQVLLAAEKEKHFMLHLIERIPFSPEFAQKRQATSGNPTTSKIPSLYKEAEDELDKLLQESTS